MDADLVILLEEVIGATSLGEFREGLLRGLLRVVPSDWASLNDLGPRPEDIAVLLIPEPRPELFDVFVELREQNPIVAHVARTRDGRASRFSDHVTRAELEALPLYQRVYRPMGVEHQIAFTLPSDATRVIGVALSRGREDYSDAERDLLNRARPLLIQAFRAALEHERLRRALAERSAPAELLAPLGRAGLTPREAQVVRKVALGSSNRDIADALGTSDRTVAKHLERAFRKLGVRSRSEAAARAWALAAEAAEAEKESGPRLRTAER